MMRPTMLKLLLFSLAALFCSCEEKDKPEPQQPNISVSSTEFNFPAEESSIKLTVTANVEWGVSCSENWVSFSPSGGIPGTTEMTVSVKENGGLSDRTATIFFKSGAYKQEFSLVQKFKPLSVDIITPEGYTLVWHDEFDAPRQPGGKASLPDPELWWYETGAGGWGNNEIQKYIPGVSGADTCAFISDGTLKIKAKKVGGEVLSIRMNTKDSWTYGYFEARLKVPVGKGTWPAFWMMPKNFTAWPDDGEIDIMEHVGYRPGYVSSSIHCKAYYHSIGTQKTAEKYVSTAQSEMHVYALEWTPDYIWGFIDGKVFYKFANDKSNNKNTWPFNAPFYLKLNLAWGGNWGGAQGIDESCLPATYEIDYVRVFQKQR